MNLTLIKVDGLNLFRAASQNSEVKIMKGVEAVIDGFHNLSAQNVIIEKGARLKAAKAVLGDVVSYGDRFEASGTKNLTTYAGTNKVVGVNGYAVARGNSMQEITDVSGKAVSREKASQKITTVNGDASSYEDSTQNINVVFKNAHACEKSNQNIKTVNGNANAYNEATQEVGLVIGEALKTKTATQKIGAVLNLNS